MLGVEAYLMLAVVLTAIGFWRERPGWFALSALLAILSIYASAFVLTGCAWTGTEWACHYTQRPDILVGSVVLFMLDAFGLYVYAFKDILRHGWRVMRGE